jgi:ribosomal protein L11 methyltransferase
VSDHRYYFRTDEAGAQRGLDLLDAAFEDEGLPLTTMEIDEDAGLWEVSVYAPGEPDESLRNRIAACIAEEFPDATIELEAFGDTDWIAKSLEGLKPVRAGRFLVHGSHDRDAVRPNDLAIELEAGQAFGTGHHGTTAGCLEMIEMVMRARPGGPRGTGAVLDLGTGSGVLAIAAAQLGPVRVLATDIDPIATKVARDNIRHNHRTSQIDCVTAPGFHSTAFSQRRSVRADHRQHPRPAADAHGARYQAQPRPRRLGDPVRHPGKPALAGSRGLPRPGHAPCENPLAQWLGNDPPQLTRRDHIAEQRFAQNKNGPRRSRLH